MSKTTMTKPYTAPDWQAKALAEGRVSRLTVPMEPQPDSDCIMARVGDTDNPDVFWTQQGPGGYVGGKSWRPPYPPGTVLFVKEAFRLGIEHDDDPARDVEPHAWHEGRVDVHYEASPDTDAEPEEMGWGKKRPARQMQKWMARTHLRVTDCRPVRMKDLSNADAAAEGYSDDPPGWNIAHQLLAGDWNDRYGYWDWELWVWDVRVERVEGGTP